MIEHNRFGLKFAARTFWPLLMLLILIAPGCSGLPARYSDNLYEGMTLYPNESFYFGPFSFNRLHSILPGNSEPACLKRESAIAAGHPSVEIFSCHAGSRQAMNKFATALVNAFAYLELASASKMRFCKLKIGLVSHDVGVYAVDTQSLSRDCARLRMLSRWSPEMTADEQQEALHAILRSTAHEAYHIAIDRAELRSRTRPQIDEEIEAALVGACAEQAVLGFSTFSLASETTASATFDSLVATSVKGSVIASQAIRNDGLLKIANSAPASFKPLLTKCAEVLKLRSQ